MKLYNAITIPTLIYASETRINNTKTDTKCGAAEAADINSRKNNIGPNKKWRY